jgi:hypothetical protein
MARNRRGMRASHCWRVRCFFSWHRDSPPFGIVAGMPYAGAMYSWVWAATSEHLADKLAEQWEQPLAKGEVEVIEQLEAEAAPMACEDCGGTGRDPGSLNPIEPEDCPSCNGTGQELHVPMLARRPAGREVLAPTRQEVA